MLFFDIEYKYKYASYLMVNKQIFIETFMKIHCYVMPSDQVIFVIYL